MELNIGDTAPDATLLHKGDDGMVRKVGIHEMLGGKKGVILFFPMVGSDHCTMEMCSISDDLHHYNDLGASIVGISVDNAHAQKLWAEQQKISFPLLSDFNKVATEAYGVLYDVFVPGILDMNGVAKRASFVVDSNSKIVFKEVLEDARELPNYEAIKKALASIEG